MIPAAASITPPNTKKIVVSWPDVTELEPELPDDEPPDELPPDELPPDEPPDELLSDELSPEPLLPEFS